MLAFLYYKDFCKSYMIDVMFNYFTPLSFQKIAVCLAHLIPLIFEGLQDLL